jgi:O-antigen ligase
VEGLGRLTSGTLSVNSYANIISAILLYFLWLRKYKKISKRTIFFLALLSLIIVIGTQTRMALLSPILVLLVYSIYNLRNNFLIRLFKFLASFIIIIFLYGLLVQTNFIQKRYSIEQIIGVNSENAKLELKENSESSSLLTRFMLFKTSLEMIKEKPITGIGVGRFNRYKKDFGFKYNVLIDSHNDLLALLCQYGIFIGSLLFFMMFILPLYYYLYYLKGKTNNKLIFLFIINFSMLFSGLSNAGLMKHQIFAFLALNLIILESLVSSLKIENTPNK